MSLNTAQKKAKRARYKANRKALGLGVVKGRGAVERRRERLKNEREAERAEARAADDFCTSLHKLDEDDFLDAICGTDDDDDDIDAFSKNYDSPCEVCGETPTVSDTDLCGPHCFGEAATAGGNW